jgi:hypothetical protein
MTTNIHTGQNDNMNRKTKLIVRIKKKNQLNFAYLDTRYSNFLETKEAASPGVPMKSKSETSTANASAAAMAIAGAPRTTMSLIAFLGNI